MIMSNRLQGSSYVVGVRHALIGRRLATNLVHLACYYVVL